MAASLRMKAILSALITDSDVEAAAADATAAARPTSEFHSLTKECAKKANEATEGNCADER